MRFPQPLVRGRLVRRYKRFLADVVVDGQAEPLTAHTPNPGAMLGLSDPGSAVWLSRSDAGRRKLPWTLHMVEEAATGALVGVDTGWPNRLAAEALAAGALPALAGHPRVRAEVRYGERSRADFLLEADDRPPPWVEAETRVPALHRSAPPQARPHRTWVEVKGVTMSREPGLAEWPDCVSARGRRHAQELTAMARSGDRSVLMFVVLRSDCNRFQIASDIDPGFAVALDEAVAQGVEVYVHDCDITTASVTLRPGASGVGLPTFGRRVGGTR